MIEYGLSVSLEGTPRTPRTPRTQSPMTNTNLYNAPRKMMSFGDFNHALNEERDSISPRVLFPNEVSRRLDFSSFPLNDDHLSSVSFVSASASASVSMSPAPVSIARSFGGHEPEHGDGRGCIGECGICYDPLQERTNHVFTMCGHLFCLRCLLKWWDTSTTCPMCREELYEPDAEAAEADADAYADEEAEEAAADVDEVADANESGDAWIQPPREYIERMQIQAQANLNDRVYWENSDSDESNASVGDDNEAEAEAEEQEQEQEQDGESHLSNVTLMDRYLHQDRGVFWSFRITAFGDTIVDYDDTVVPLSQYEVRDLKRNREIAMILFSRIRFRETLFDTNVRFLGGVFPGRWVPQREWIERFIYPESSSLETKNNKMYEFVIRKYSEFSPFVETNVFGFIKETAIVRLDGDVASRADDDWENLHEYAFIAKIFTPGDILIDDDTFTSYGKYDMNEGTVELVEVTIQFSHIRRLYCIEGCCEQSTTAQTSQPVH